MRVVLAVLVLVLTLSAWVAADNVFSFAPARSVPPLPRVDGAAGLRRLVDAAFPAPPRVRAYVDDMAQQAATVAGRGHGGDDDGKDVRELAYADLTTPVMLETFYADLRDSLPHALGYQPVPDCERGRYMFVGVQRIGFGTTAGSEFLKQMYQAHFNLTGVVAPFVSMHFEESRESQAQFWRLDDWEVTEERLLAACPPDSPIWQRQLDLRDQPLTHFMTMYGQIRAFASTLYWGGLGGVVRVHTIGSIALVTDDMREFVLKNQWLLEVRWNSQNRPIGGNYLAPSMLRRARSSRPVHMDLSVHIRRGDIMDPAAGGAAPRAEYAVSRYRPLEFFADAVNRLLAILDAATPGLPRRLLTITIYSEGNVTEFASLVRNFTAQGYRTRVDLDWKTSRVFARIAESDINVLALTSEFSNYFRIHSHRLRVGSDVFGISMANPDLIRRDLSIPAGFPVGGYGYDFDAPAMRDQIRTNIVLLWHFLVEWKLRRAELNSRCAGFTLQCLRSNPYLLTPLGPIARALLDY